MYHSKMIYFSRVEIKYRYLSDRFDKSFYNAHNLTMFNFME